MHKFKRRNKSMNVSTKRLLSILLSLAMVLAMLPMAVFAETATTLYVKPNANWIKDGARFAAYFFGNGEKWLDCTDADGDGKSDQVVTIEYALSADSLNIGNLRK